MTAEERAIVARVRTYMESRVRPVINKFWSEDAFPFELLPAFRALNIGGLGLEGFVVVHTPDATLVCPKNRAEDLKKLVEEIRAKGLDRHL